MLPATFFIGQPASAVMLNYSHDKKADDVLLVSFFYPESPPSGRVSPLAEPVGVRPDYTTSVLSYLFRARNVAVADDA